MIYGLQDFFFLATWWVGYFFTAVQEFFSITFVLHAIFFFRQALAGNFFSKSPTPPPPPQELNGRPLNTQAKNFTLWFAVLSVQTGKEIAFLFSGGIPNVDYLRNRKQEMLWQHEPQTSVSTAFSSSPKLSRVFL